jgi:glycosyltransferase involved in cell wall biosynthesis
VTAPLLVFGEDWGRHPSSTQHLVTQLAHDRHVVWVDSIGLRRPRLDVADLRRVLGKVGRMVRRPPPGPAAAMPEGLTRVSPRAVSWPGSPVAAQFNRHALGRQLEGVLCRERLSRPILWTSLPTAAPLLGRLGERRVVYYCGDDFGALAGVDHGPVTALERTLAARADLILAASPLLAEKFPGDRTVVVPHGVDHALFSTSRERPDDLPAGPVAGFYGSLSAWIDVELLAAAADALPAWQFVLVGEVRTDVSALVSRPNVRLMGPRTHGELPAYAQHWDVSLLPFRDCPQITACNPLKLREYLAAGSHIATTDFPALDPYRSVLAVRRPDETLAATILRAATDGPRRAERQAAVAGETWTRRASDVAALLDAL